MRAVYAVLLFAFVCSVSVARADVIFTGSVSTSGSSGRSCSMSGSGSGSFGLDCEDSQTQGYGKVGGSGDAFSGSMYLHVFGGDDRPVGFASSMIELELNDNYVVVGGTGVTTVNFALNPSEYLSGFIPTVNCSFTFDGMAAQSCGPVGLPIGIPTIISETVEYGVPFSVELDVDIFGNALDEPGDAFFNYNFAQPGLVTATPEPSSVLLLLPGLAGVMFAARSRLRVG